MGTSVPPEPRWSQSASPGEIDLWRWAVEELPDRVLVLPQVLLTVRDRARPDEAELDLVLIDPEAGVTVIEVKDGTLGYSGGRWVQNGKQARRDPVAQAKRGRSVLEDAIGRSALDNPGDVAWRWAVATPGCDLDAPGEPVLPDEQLLDARARGDLASRYRRLVGKLELGEQPLGAGRAEYLARHLRGREVEGRATIRTAVDHHEAQVTIHTESHRNVLNHFAHNRHVLVRGAAGTGKTVLALEAAARSAAQGQRVLLACWNVVLGAWLRTALTAQLEAMGSPVAEQVSDDPTGRVVVTHVAALAERTVGPMPTGLDRAELFYDWLPTRFMDLSPGATGGEFDLVVLDEAQDLSEAWVLAVAALVAREGRWYAFTDRQQDLFDSGAALPDFLAVEHELRENFRNSRQIAAFASQFGDIELDCVTGDGPPVRYLPCPADRVVGRAAELGRKLMKQEGIAARDLAVLHVFHNPMKDHADQVADAAMAGELIHTNSATFKGMERPAVVLGIDLREGDEHRAAEVAKAIYTAATRARSLLTVVCDPDLAVQYGYTDLATKLRTSVTS